MSKPSPASQLLARHIEETSLANSLVVDPLNAEDFADSAFRNASVWLFKDIRHSHQDTISFPQTPANQYATVIIFFPKAKAKLNWLLAQLKDSLSQSAQVYIIGHNKGGIRSLPKMSVPALDNMQKVASGNHCLLYRACYQPNNAESKGFSYFPVTVNHQSIQVASLPGVFSHNELDEGSKLLLQNLPDKIQGHVLDFACGCGVIGSYIKKLHPEVHLTQSDIDCLAISATAETQRINDISGQNIVADGLTKISSRFNWIFTNPPFHTGLKIDYHITEAFIKGCKDVLYTNGRIYLVANRFLKYPQLLKNHFQRVEVVAEDNKFKVYCAYNR
ncbi:methyltransferase [Gayadomonas joobiniege]|uniref:methyltransferase n=1 Tax=Gayadomonas joobiniege TaxID=1234606 RepID=UPI00037363FA|nr:methyltransferase [Gayadomonas joobiniege]